MSLVTGPVAAPAQAAQRAIEGSIRPGRYILPRPATRLQRTGTVPSFLVVVVPAAAIGALIVAGISLGSGAVQSVGALMALASALLAPEIGLAILVFLAPLPQPPAVPAPGLSFILAFALLLGCVYRLPVDRPRLRLSAAGLFLAGFMLYVAAQQLPDLISGYSGDLSHMVGYLFFQLLTGFALVLAAAYILRGRSPMPVLAMALAGATLTALITILTFDKSVVGPPFAALVATGDIGLRAAGPFTNPNYLGTFVAATIVGAVALWPAVSSRLGRVALLVVAGLSLIALIEAQSRGAMIACFIGVAAVIWLRHRALTIALVVGGVIAALLVYPAFVDWRLTNLRGEVTDAGYIAMTQSDDVRLDATLAGPAMFLSSPIFGVGFGQYSEKSVEISGLKTGINAHNWYVNVLAEQGLTGTILWVGATAATALALRRRTGTAQLVGIGMFAMVVIGLVFLEGPTSFQVIALPAIFLVAALTADWRPNPSQAAPAVHVAAAAAAAPVDHSRSPAPLPRRTKRSPSPSGGLA
jgi:O-antigen ligase